jgi:hypothetical protein
MRKKSTKIAIFTMLFIASVVGAEENSDSSIFINIENDVVACGYLYPDIYNIVSIRTEESAITMFIPEYATSWARKDNTINIYNKNLSKVKFYENNIFWISSICDSNNIHYDFFLAKTRISEKTTYDINYNTHMPLFSMHHMAKEDDCITNIGIMKYRQRQLEGKMQYDFIKKSDAEFIIFIYNSSENCIETWKYKTNESVAASNPNLVRNNGLDMAHKGRFFNEEEWVFVNKKEKITISDFKVFNIKNTVYFFADNGKILIFNKNDYSFNEITKIENDKNIIIVSDNKNDVFAIMDKGTNNILFSNKMLEKKYLEYLCDEIEVITRDHENSKIELEELFQRKYGEEKDDNKDASMRNKGDDMEYIESIWNGMEHR